MDAVQLLTSVAGLQLPEAAREFASAGVAVFACVPGSKRPLTSHGFHDASVNPRLVADWWARWPEANIGLPTGGDRVDVVDIDVHGPVSGFVGFERARRAGLVEGWAALVRTPSGGVHAYYPADPAHPQPSWQAAAVGVDFRGNRGYVIAPPSIITSEGRSVTYELITTARSAPVPTDAVALRNFLDPRPSRASAPTHAIRVGTDAERLSAWVASRGEGERNQALFWAACRLAEAGTEPEATRQALGPAARRIGLPDVEVTATIRSAYRRAKGVALTSGPVEARRPVARPPIGQIHS
ncbi:bifunctional DNA primase/polymerase [Rathayibacter soli]|uniref:bifunctional DNA primase/polymerase n=1 Tax=Rathayibacter soli TaxID=3144168 RepID=UPI0027E4E605|nr:bifunctional DNA primase/polymerase [Glaciibacter superstes]